MRTCRRHVTRNYRRRYCFVIGVSSHEQIGYAYYQMTTLTAFFCRIKIDVEHLQLPSRTDVLGCRCKSLIRVVEIQMQLAAAYNGCGLSIIPLIQIKSISTVTPR